MPACTSLLDVGYTLLDTPFNDVIFGDLTLILHLMLTFPRICESFSCLPTVLYTVYSSSANNSQEIK